MFGPLNRLTTCFLDFKRKQNSKKKSIMIKENNSKRVLKKNGLGRFGLCMLQLQAAVGTQGECFLWYRHIILQHLLIIVCYLLLSETTLLNLNFEIPWKGWLILSFFDSFTGSVPAISTSITWCYWIVFSFSTISVVL